MYHSIVLFICDIAMIYNVIYVFFCADTVLLCIIIIVQ